jgi:3-oxoacyl-[acyl-carrier protein] reductase
MRTAVVTGTSSGIGQAIATRLLGDGWRVIGLDRAAGKIDNPAFTSIGIDLGVRAARPDEIDKIDAIDALVHAAGIMRGGLLGELDHDAGDLLWRIHVDAAIRLADHFAPRLTNGGRIVMIGSRAAKGIAAKSQYGAAKAALTALARAWALELIGRGITVNVVAPAATETAMLVDPDRVIVPPETPPLGRRIKPAEVAALVSFLLSEDAAAITGQEISICGGASL